jgi:hypothetical protein
VSSWVVLPFKGFCPNSLPSWNYFVPPGPGLQSNVLLESVVLLAHQCKHHAMRGAIALTTTRTSFCPTVTRLGPSFHQTLWSTALLDPITQRAQPSQPSVLTGSTAPPKEWPRKLCPRGFMCPPSRESPSQDPIGYYPKFGSVSPQTCLAGTYYDREGLGFGFLCPGPPGFYCPLEVTVPTPCPPGSFCPQATGLPLPCSGGCHCPEGSSGGCRVPSSPGPPPLHLAHTLPTTSCPAPDAVGARRTSQHLGAALAVSLGGLGPAACHGRRASHAAQPLAERVRISTLRKTGCRTPAAANLYLRRDRAVIAP